MADTVEVVRSKELADIPHGFLGRIGGVSTGLVAGLQVGLGAGDDDDAVAENRRRAVDAVAPGRRLVTVYQVHSPEAVIVGEPWPHEDRPRADAMVTDRPGIVLGIVTADCAPVLLADAKAGVVAAAHAGWRGAHAGVLEATIGRMRELGADPGSIAAAIGPAIAQSSYEVDHAFRERFEDRHAQFFAPGRPGKWQFDLEGYAAHRLRSCGVERVEPLGIDTYAEERRFYSYRRATHRAEPNYGRQFSLIALPG